MRVRYTIEIRDYHEFFFFVILYWNTWSIRVIDIKIPDFLQNHTMYNI